MKKLYFYNFILFASIFFIISCSSKSKYATSFKIVKYEAILTDRSTNTDSLAKQQYDMLFDNEAFIKFFDNDSLNLLNGLGKYSLGEWSHDNNTSIFEMNINNIRKIIFAKKEEEGDSDEFEYLVLKSQNSKGLTINLLLKKDDYYESKKTDLLSLSSNWWRVKPSKKESKELIKKRIIAQIDYMIKYFELIDDKQYGSFQHKPLTSPYKFYSNGIGLDPSELTEYNKIFNNYDDAATAYDLLDKGMKSISVYPADKESFTKGYSNALKEIKKFIELS
jgi:hypothetical protein